MQATRQGWPYSRRRLPQRHDRLVYSRATPCRWPVCSLACLFADLFVGWPTLAGLFVPLQKGYYAGAMRISASPFCTMAPLVARILTTRPETSDCTSLKTFMASISATTWPTWIISPTETKGGEVGEGAE